MAKNIFDSLSPAAAFAVKLFTAAGLDFSAMVAAGDETALKTHLDSIAAGAGAKEAIEQATAHLTAELATAQGALATAKQTVAFHGLVSAALAAKGITFAAGADAAAITSALEARLSTLAGEELARHGLKSFPAQTVVADAAAAPQQSAKSELKGLARVQAAWATHGRR